MQANMAARSSHLGEMITNATATIATEQRETLQGVFDHSLQQVAEFLSGDLCLLETDMSQFIEELAEQLQEEIGALAGDFRERASDLVDDLGEYAEDQIKDEIENAFKQVLEDAVEEFAEELIKSIALTQAGVATSATLAPLVPALVAAEKLLKVINSIF